MHCHLCGVMASGPWPPPLRPNLGYRNSLDSHVSKPSTSPHSFPQYQIKQRAHTYTHRIVEMTVGLTVACMPAFATVVRHHGFPLGTFWTFLNSKMSSFSTKISSKSKSLMHKVGSNDDLPYDIEGSNSARGGDGIAAGAGLYVEVKEGV